MVTAGPQRAVCRRRRRHRSGTDHGPWPRALAFITSSPALDEARPFGGGGRQPTPVKAVAEPHHEFGARTGVQLLHGLRDLVHLPNHTNHKETPVLSRCWERRCAPDCPRVELPPAGKTQGRWIGPRLARPAGLESNSVAGVRTLLLTLPCVLSHPCSASFSAPPPQSPRPKKVKSALPLPANCASASASSSSRRGSRHAFVDRDGSTSSLVGVALMSAPAHTDPSRRAAGGQALRLPGGSPLAVALAPASPAGESDPRVGAPPASRPGEFWRNNLA